MLNVDKRREVVVCVMEKVEEDLEGWMKKVYVGIGGECIGRRGKNVRKELGEDRKI